MIDNEKVSNEAYAYTPGLKVKWVEKVIKERKLPIQGNVLVEVGNRVSHDTMIAKAQMPGEPHIINAALKLGVEPNRLRRFIVKKEDDPVDEEETIAKFTALFGLINKVARSPVRGIIESISDVTGNFVVRGSPISVMVDAHIPGEVIEVIPGEGAVIESNAAIIQGIFGIGGEAHGEVRVLVDSSDQILTADAISEDDRGCVLVGGSQVTLDAIEKAVKVGAVGIVSGGIKHLDLIKFTGEQIGVAITGYEDVGLTFIITEGFGRMTMSRRAFDILNRFEGYMASINGATQIRAGVMRPEIIIPYDSSSERARASERSISRKGLAGGMKLGTSVRVIRQPYFGAIGQVVSLPVELQEIETRSQVRILVVELEDGRRVTVPRANVEIIEE